MSSISLSPTVWVRSTHPLPHAHFRLFCLSYGGGDAALFHSWPQSLPADMQERLEICPIQLPGRANRLREPLFSRLSELVDILVPDTLEHSPLSPFLDRPFAFFGVSLGGLIAFEIAHALESKHHLTAATLCVAACRAPHLPGPYGIEGVEHLTDEDLAEQVRAVGGLPASLLADEKHLRLILPKIRADAMMAAGYVYNPGIALHCPITVCAGTNDGFLTWNELAAWQAHTTQAFYLYTFPGDHFFLRETSSTTREQLLEYIARGVRAEKYQPIERK